MKRKVLIILFYLFTQVGKGQPGTLDNTFINDFKIVNTSFITAMAIQSDGKIVLGGLLDITVNGIKKRNIIRLNENGSIDYTFNNGIGFDSTLFYIVTQKDDKLLISGEFNSYNGQSCGHFIRLDKAGKLDRNFEDALDKDLKFIRALAVQNDQKIIVQAYNNFDELIILRLNADGSTDNFYHQSKVDYGIVDVAFQNDGQLLLIGGFQYIDDVYCYPIVRIQKNGRLDLEFNKLVESLNLSGSFLDIEVQKNNKILLAGGYLSSHGERINNIVRFNSDMSFDPEFRKYNAFEDGSYINSIYLQDNGQILVGGYFYNLDWVTSQHILRTNNNGTLDKAFKTGDGFDDQVFYVARQNSKQVIAVGDFLEFNHLPKTHIARLNLYDSEEFNISIIPNPVIESVHLNSSQTIEKITVFDLSGREVYGSQPQDYNIDLDLKQLHPGVYYIKLTTPSGIQHAKLIKK